MGEGTKAIKIRGERSIGTREKGEKKREQDEVL